MPVGATLFGVVSTATFVSVMRKTKGPTQRDGSTARLVGAAGALLSCIGCADQISAYYDEPGLATGAGGSATGGGTAAGGEAAGASDSTGTVGGAPIDDDVCVFAPSPPAFVDDVDVVGARVQLELSASVDPSTLEGRVRLSRIDLDEAATVPIDVRLEGDRVLVAEPTEALSFFADYALTIDEGLTSLGGQPCPTATVVLSTRRPKPLVRPLRPAPVTAAVVRETSLFAVSSAGLLLQTYDIGDVAAPTVVASTALDCAPTSIAAWGDHLAVGCGSAGLRLLDASDPLMPEVVATLTTPGYVHDVVAFSNAEGDFVALADGAGALRLVDVTDTSFPIEASVRNPSGAQPPSVLGLAVEGDLLAVAEGEAGIALVSVTDPYAPVVRQAFVAPSSPVTSGPGRLAQDVALDGGRLFVALPSYGIQSFDARNPTSVQLLGDVTFPWGICDISCNDVVGDLTVAGDVLYGTSALTGGFRAPIGPTGKVGTPVAMPIEGRTDSVVIGSQAVFVGAERGLSAFTDASGSPVALYSEAKGAGTARGIAVRGNGLYATSASRGLEVYSIDDPLDPSALALLPTPGITADFGLYDVVVRDERVFVLDGRKGILFFDASDPKNLVPLGSTAPALPNFDGATSFELIGDVMYACDGNNPLRVFDVSDLAAPELVASVGSYNAFGNCFELLLDGPVLYVAGGGGLGVVDVSDPLAPSIVDVLPLSAAEPLYSLTKVGSTLLVSSRFRDYDSPTGSSGRLSVLDVSDPLAPALVHRTASLPTLGRIVTRGTKAYVTAGSTGVAIFDLRDPLEPVLEGTIAPGFGSVTDVTIGGDVLYATRSGAGLAVVALGRTE